MESVRLVMLVENTTCCEQLTPEHGLAVYIEAGEVRGLYDTGNANPPLLVENAGKLGVELDGLDWVAISHGHNDHGGGIGDLLTYISRPVVMHFGSGALIKKYSRKPNKPLEDKFLLLSKAEMQDKGGRLQEHAAGCSELSPGIYYFGPSPMLDPYELIPERHVIATANPGELVQDDFNDERTLALDTGDGIIIITGCAHRGVINIIRQVQELFPGKGIRAVLGGFHLMDQEDTVINYIAAELLKLEVGAVGLAHCTGARAMELLGAQLGAKSFHFSTGVEVIFSPGSPGIEVRPVLD